MTVSEPRKLLRAREVARRLNMPVSTVYDAARRDMLPGIVRMGRLVRFDASKLDAWIDGGGKALPEDREIRRIGKAYE